LFSEDFVAQAEGYPYDRRRETLRKVNVNYFYEGRQA